MQSFLQYEKYCKFLSLIVSIAFLQVKTSEGVRPWISYFVTKLNLEKSNLLVERGEGDEKKVPDEENCSKLLIHFPVVEVRDCHQEDNSGYENESRIHQTCSHQKVKKYLTFNYKCSSKGFLDQDIPSLARIHFYNTYI